jgi:hypothetical protein
MPAEPTLIQVLQRAFLITEDVAVERACRALINAYEDLAAGSGRAAERVEGAIKLGANPAEETEPIHMGWMSSFTPELQDAITAAANCPCSSYPCTCQRADQTQEGDR